MVVVVYPRKGLPVALLAVLVLSAPSGVSQATPSVREDAAECFEQISLNGTCSVLYAHVEDVYSRGFLSVQDLPEHAPDSIATTVEAPEVTLQPNMGKIHWGEEGSIEGSALGGPAVPVKRVEGVPIIGHWFLSADPTFLSMIADGAPTPGAGAAPCVTVEMFLIDPDADQGLLARGKATRTIVSADGDEAIPVSDPCEGADGDLRVGDMEEFRLELEPVVETPLVLNKFQVEVRWYFVDLDGGSVAGLQTPHLGWTIGSGSEYRPRLVLPVEDPVEGVETTVQQEDETVAFSALLGSPWGAFEFAPEAIENHRAIEGVQPDSLRFTVKDEDGVPLDLVDVDGPRFRYYSGHVMQGDDRLNVTWLWKPGRDLAAGLYTLGVEADNLQGTATARAEAVYEHGTPAPQEAPVPFMILLTLVLFGWFAFTRRRGS